MFWNVQFYEKAGFAKARSTAEAKRRDTYSAQPKYRRCVAMELKDGYEKAETSTLR